MRRLEGKVALVTGAGQGIGFTTAKCFIAEGAFVFITSFDEQEINAAAEKLGPNAFPVVADSTRVADLERLYAVVKDKKGCLDILFTNAGRGHLSPLETMTEEHFDTHFDLNVRGVVFTVQKALPVLSEGASIIMPASICAHMGMEAFSIYSATKAAVRNLARSWCLELRARKIRVNTISPGAVPTAAVLGLAPTEEGKKQLLSNFTAGVPLGRMATTEDIAKVVVFLASDDSAFINGEDIIIDGGYLQW
jgi:NAD(P)-dependent dehydrogenase (short-subunit alcohol dehydrogenase family)